MDSSFDCTDYSDVSDHIYYPEYSESPKSDEEFGPEPQSLLQFKSEKDGLVQALKKNKSSNTLLLAATFKEQVGNSILRLFSDSIPFVVSGKIERAPAIAISLPKYKKRFAFPLYESESLNSIIQASDQSSPDNETVEATNCQLDHLEFQILNKEWSSYLSEVVIPRIQKDLQLEFACKPNLRKLVWNTTGSFGKSFCDTNKEDGTFGMLLIQLPSFYGGGKLMVRHENRTEKIDFSTTLDSQNQFSMFYTAFYTDCEYEVQPVASGITTYLIYNLISTVEQSEKSLPSADQTSHHARELDLIELLQNDWPRGQKLIYCLSHKYSQNNLSIENLKAADKITAKFFKDHADQCSLSVMLAVLKRRKSRFVKDVPYVVEDSYEEYAHHADVSSVDSDDPEVDFDYTYDIKHIKTQDSEYNVLPRIDVDFKDEVIPENCFDNVKAFYKDQLNNSLVRAVECMKLYQCAAILIFKRDDLIPVLIKGHAKESKMERVLLKEIDENKNQISNELVKKKFLKWAYDLLDIYLKYPYIEDDARNSTKFLDGLILLDDNELLRKYFQVMNFEVKTIPSLFQICTKYGWREFSKELATVFCKVRAQDRFDYFQKFIEFEADSDIDPNKIDTLRDIRIEILNKFEQELKNPKTRNSHPWYSNELYKKIFDNVLLLDDVSLLKSYFNILKIEESILPTLFQTCQQYGWATFAKQIVEKFDKMQEHERIRCLKAFIEFEIDNHNNFTEKQSLCQSIMKAIAEKFDFELSRDRWFKNYEKKERTKKFLIQLWPIGKELDSVYLVKYVKSKSFEVAVPALVEIAENNSLSSENNFDVWIELANHYNTEMKNSLQRENEAPRTWELNVKIGCTCRDCKLVNDFLKDPFKVIFKFRGIRPRRIHVEENLKELHVECSTTVKEQLRILKLERTGLPESKTRDFILKFMPKLCSYLPGNNK